MKRHIAIKSKGILYLVGAAIISISCTNNFQEYNTNPDEVTGEMADWDNAKNGSFFLQMQRNVIPVDGASVYQVEEVMTGDGFAGYFGSPDPNINSASRYSWSGNTNWPGMMFNGGFNNIMNAWRELKKAIGNEEDPRYAVVQILKVTAMHRVTDTYGPIPYLKFGIDKEVAYDTQKSVYYRFFEELDAAVKVLNNYATNGDKVFSEWDCVYRGDTKAWVKFANTLRFRLAMHLSNVDIDKAKTEIKAALDAPHGFVENQSDQAFLKHVAPIATYESPLFIINGWDDIAMGATIESYMNGYEDPRRSAYFIPASDGKYRGIRAGLPKEISKDAYVSRKLFSRPNVTSITDVLWMRSSEIFFLKAEAALRWTDADLPLNGTVQDFYEQGIRRSFEENGVSGVNDYLLNENENGMGRKPLPHEDLVYVNHSTGALSQITVKWVNSDNFDIKLERIITQKYLALFPEGQEAWTDFRRTGYPKVFPVVKNESAGNCVNDKEQIHRLPYPTSEYNTNRDAVKEGTRLLGGPDNAGTRVWWNGGSEKNQ